MELESQTINAECIAVYPNKARIIVDKLEDFRVAGEKLSVGSYLRISDSEDCALIAIIENFSIEIKEAGYKSEANVGVAHSGNNRRFVIEAVPLGFLDSDGVFSRGGNRLAIPPTKVSPATREEINQIYSQIGKDRAFCFSKLSQDNHISVPVDGDRLFNKHFAIVGATGSGKSHTVSVLLQNAMKSKCFDEEKINNSHIIVFDMHGEYKTAFPEAQYLNVDSLYLPYWMMNEDELEDLLLETGDNQAYNQSSLFRRVVTRNKELKSGNDRVSFGTPVKFSASEVVNCLRNLSRETVSSSNKNCPSFVGVDGQKEFTGDQERFDCYFRKIYEFQTPKTNSVTSGVYRDGTLDKFISRLAGKIDDERLKFIFGNENDDESFESVFRNLVGYCENKVNMTLIDLSGVPFEVLSICVSLVSRLIFEYGYYLRRHDLLTEGETPFLILYEEAHKYVPKSNEAQFKSCRKSIERIAKEGRKYGVSLGIVSQRPAELSETIFSQCNNVIAMRLTNPEDQHYVKRLLPDSLGPIVDTLPTLAQGDAIIIGDAIVMPSLVHIDPCDPKPSSEDIRFLQEWKKPWVEPNIKRLISKWTKDQNEN